MHTNITKTIAMITLAIFCVTQITWAAPGPQNLRQMGGEGRDAKAGGALEQDIITAGSRARADGDVQAKMTGALSIPDGNELISAFRQLRTIERGTGLLTEVKINELTHIEITSKFLNGFGYYYHVKGWSEGELEPLTLNSGEIVRPPKALVRWMKKNKIMRICIDPLILSVAFADPQRLALMNIPNAPASIDLAQRTHPEGPAAIRHEGTGGEIVFYAVVGNKRQITELVISTVEALRLHSTKYAIVDMAIPPSPIKRVDMMLDAVGASARKQLKEALSRRQEASVTGARADGAAVGEAKRRVDEVAEYRAAVAQTDARERALFRAFERARPYIDGASTPAAPEQPQAVAAAAGAAVARADGTTNPEFEELFALTYEKIVELGNPVSFVDYGQDIVNYILWRFQEIKARESKKWILLEADGANGFRTMIESMQQQILQQARDLGLTGVNVREELGDSYSILDDLIRCVKEQFEKTADDFLIVLFFRNPEDLFREKVSYQGPMRALGSHHCVIVTHYDNEEMYKILGDVITSPFFNIFFSVTMTETERTRLDNLGKKLAGDLTSRPEPDTHFRVNLVGGRRTGKTYMLRQAASFLAQREVSVEFIDMQQWEHRPDRLLELLKEDQGNKVLLIDEAEALWAVPEVWVEIEKSTDWVVYASANPLRECEQTGNMPEEIKDACARYNIINITSDEVAVVSPAAGSPSEAAKEGAAAAGAAVGEAKRRVDEVAEYRAAVAQTDAREKALLGAFERVRPYIDGASTPAAPEQPQTIAAAAGAKILVVDDDVNFAAVKTASLNILAITTDVASANENIRKILLDESVDLTAEERIALEKMAVREWQDGWTLADIERVISESKANRVIFDVGDITDPALKENIFAKLASLGIPVVEVKDRNKEAWVAALHSV